MKIMDEYASSTTWGVSIKEENFENVGDQKKFDDTLMGEYFNSSRDPNLIQFSSNQLQSGQKFEVVSTFEVPKEFKVRKNKRIENFTFEGI